MYNALLVFIGGGLGALTRWGISLALVNATNRIWFATFVANLVGCTGLFFVGKFLNSDASQLFVRVAFFGGLTTFSSFSYEVVTLMKMGRIWEGGCVVALNVFCGILVGVLVLR